MLSYITENEYKSLLGVESVPENFDNLAIRASAILNRKTFGNIDINSMDSEMVESVKYVTCLIVNELVKNEDYTVSVGNLSSTNIEGWSESYKNYSEINSDIDNSIDQIIYDFLGGTNLLKSKEVVLYE